MKLGIVIGTNEAEVAWNAFRLGVTALNAKHNVKVFLLNKGVEVEKIKDSKYDVKEQIESFAGKKGEILSCGTCLKSRKIQAGNVCNISTMKELLQLVEESEKVLTFG